MGKTFIIADTHFGDSGAILKYEGRPFSNGAEMDRAMVENWNRVVGEEDTVYHLGDVAVGRSEQELSALLKELKGRKILVMGNHDRSFDVRHWMELGFAEVYPLPVLFEDFYILSHEPLYVNTASPYANLFGHVHGNPTYRTVSARSYCACVERNNYAPVPFEQIRSQIASESRGLEKKGEPR